MIDAGWAIGVCVGDYNNDGFEDLFLTYYGQNRLYRNNGDGTFTDVTAKAGLLHPRTRFGSGCTFVDYNRDGLLDLFVSNYVEIDLATAPKPSLDMPNCNYEGVPVNCGPERAWSRRRILSIATTATERSPMSRRNRASPRCADHTDSPPSLSTPTKMAGRTFSWPATRRPACCCMNNHDGTFREEALLRGVALSSDGQAMAGMGVGVGDYDLDGHLDIRQNSFLKIRPPAFTTTTAKASSKM